MKAETVKCYAQVCACNTRVAAMNASNMQCAFRGESMTYSDTDFYNEADLLDQYTQEVSQIIDK